MVRIDFSPYGYEFESCPLWWQNFVNASAKAAFGDESTLELSDQVWDKMLDNALAEHGCVMVDGLDNLFIDYLEFGCEEDLVMFKLRWA
jgi:hypothetical protein